jgi:hypothetical protein
MSYTKKDRDTFLELLRETPLVSFVCKKVGISRMTYYRWRRSNLEFRDAVDDALEQGRFHINDMAIGNLIQKIREKDMRATVFWLQHNHEQFVPKRTVYVEPHSHAKLRPGVPCKFCGHIEHRGFDPGRKKKTRKQKIKEIVSIQHEKVLEEKTLREFGSQFGGVQDFVEKWPPPEDLQPPTPAD